MEVVRYGYLEMIRNVFLVIVTNRLSETFDTDLEAKVIIFLDEQVLVFRVRCRESCPSCEV